ncbi:MAG: hypothetical protein K6U80_09980 [Firmicutes bacterium]|nr:hypothetical protein [Bacillota bacterium]
MKKSAYLLICLAISLVSFPGPSSAGEPKPDIEIKLINPEITGIEPGKVITISLLVINRSKDRYSFLEQPVLPPDWQLLMPAASFTLDPEAQQVRLLTVVIPATCPAGAYQIIYSIISDDNQHYTYTGSIAVKVASVTGVQSLIEAKPAVVVAGEHYTLQLRYINTGNSLLTITFTVNALPACRLESAPLEISLPPHESQLLTICIQTDAKLTANIIQVINIKAIDRNSSFIYCDDTILVDVIPQTARMFDIYQRLPGQLKIIAAAETGVSGQPKPGLQIDFSTSGSIDGGKNKLALHLLTPNLLGETSNKSPEYFQFSYANNLLTANIGNQSFILSPLTRRWDDYYNLNIGFNIQESLFGIVWPENKENYLKQNEWGLYYGNQLNPYLNLKVNFLNWSNGAEVNRIYSLQSEIKPGPDTLLNLEYGFGDRPDNFAGSTAYRIVLAKDSTDFINYSLESIYAAPNFLGNYSDMCSTNGSTSFSFNDQTQVSFSFHRYRNNLNLNPEKDSAYDDLAYNANLSFIFNPRTLLIFTLEDLQKQNRLPLPGYFTKERLLKIGVQYQLFQWKLIPSITTGAYEDLLNADTDLVYLLNSLILNYTPNPDQSYSLYTNIGDSNYTKTPNANNMIGVSATLRLKNNFNLNLEYQKNHLFTENTLSSECFTLNLSYNVNRYDFRLHNSLISNSDRDDFYGSFRAAYSIPCRVPISKRADLGALKGRVYEAGQPGNPGIAGVILRINGVSTVTDQEGEFSFASIPPGVYSIAIDKALIGLNLVPVEKLPLIVEVKQGEDKTIAIEMVKAGRVKGKMVILGPDQEHQSNSFLADSGKLFSVQDNNQLSAGLDSGELKERRALTNIIVELTDGNELFRQATGENGQFSFEGIRPGKWSLKAYDNNLPPHYYFEQPEFEIDLNPDEEKEVIFKAIPEVRPVQIIDEGEIN